MLEQHEQTCRISVRPLTGKPTIVAAGSDPIFSREFMERLADKHYELSALGIGVLLEQSSIDFYKDWAAKTRDRDLKKLLQSLVAWEKTHLDALMTQRRTFMERDWNNARFYPF
jgi:hypothetical protein